MRSTFFPFTLTSLCLASRLFATEVFPRELELVPLQNLAPRPASPSQIISPPSGTAFNPTGVPITVLCNLTPEQADFATLCGVYWQLAPIAGTIRMLAIGYDDFTPPRLSALLARSPALRSQNPVVILAGHGAFRPDGYGNNYFNLMWSRTTRGILGPDYIQSVTQFFGAIVRIVADVCRSGELTAVPGFRVLLSTSNYGFASDVGFVRAVQSAIGWMSIQGQDTVDVDDNGYVSFAELDSFQKEWGFTRWGTSYPVDDWILSPSGREAVLFSVPNL